ncbi:chemocyanin-like [Canna indica]|uniref:Chemocyanin-like n=1 Tax=Canna indica TaxID=4628 RepID=A0AAQ3L0Q8_9LILI|nr:chemocyanin-like [Canna indica]
MASHFLLTRTFAAVFFLSLLAQHCVKSTDYTVGDADGWNTGSNYLLWSKEYNFTVGDVLVFKYVPVQHNVYQVTEATYRFCDSSSGVVKTYGTGNDRVTLAEATSYWFICAVAGHCQGGMKLGVSVGDQSSSSGGGGGVADAPSPPTEQGSGAAGGRVMRWWNEWMMMMCLSLGMLNWVCGI